MTDDDSDRESSCPRDTIPDECDDRVIRIGKNHTGRERIVIRDSCGVILDAELPSDGEIDEMLNSQECDEIHDD